MEELASLLVMKSLMDLMIKVGHHTVTKSHFWFKRILEDFFSIFQYYFTALW